MTQRQIVYSPIIKPSAVCRNIRIYFKDARLIRDDKSWFKSTVEDEKVSNPHQSNRKPITGQFIKRKTAPLRIKPFAQREVKNGRLTLKC